jgi:DNA adenine methylase
MRAHVNAVPIIPWIGGKGRLAKHILPLFPDHLCYVEPFAGAAALFFKKEPVKSEVLNDINGDLVNLYRVVKYHLDEFVRHFRWSLVSRQIFKWCDATPAEVLTDIQRAARFYYLQRLAFGGRVEQRTFGTATTSGPRINLLRIEEDLSDAHLRLSRATIEHLPWRECVERYDREHTLFYLDPPYWGTEGYGVTFDLEEYRRIAEALRTAKGKAVVSVNDIAEMRSIFRGFRTQRLAIQYTVGGGRTKAKKTGELVIRNW